MRLTRRGRLAITLTVTTLVMAAGFATYAITRTSASSTSDARSASPPCRIDVGRGTLS